MGFLRSTKSLLNSATTINFFCVFFSLSQLKQKVTELGSAVNCTKGKKENGWSQAFVGDSEGKVGKGKEMGGWMGNKVCENSKGIS